MSYFTPSTSTNTTRARAPSSASQPPLNKVDTTLENTYGLLKIFPQDYFTNYTDASETTQHLYFTLWANTLPQPYKNTENENAQKWKQIARIRRSYIATRTF